MKKLFVKEQQAICRGKLQTVYEIAQQQDNGDMKYAPGDFMCFIVPGTAVPCKLPITKPLEDITEYALCGTSRLEFVDERTFVQETLPLRVYEVAYCAKFISLKGYQEAYNVLQKNTKG